MGASDTPGVSSAPMISGARNLHDLTFMQNRLAAACLALTTLLFAAAAPTVSAHGTHGVLMAALDARLAEQPENANLWYQRAVLQFEHDDWSATTLDLDTAERLAPGQFPVLWVQGQVLDKQGKPQEAKSALDAFLAKTPDHSGALASRARVESQLGLDDEAIRDFRAALANRPDAQPDLIQEVAQALAKHALTDESVKALETGIARLGAIPSLELKILEIEVNAGRGDSALRRIDALQRSAPRPEPWMEKRAGLLAQAGRLGESLAAWRALIGHLKSLPAAERDSHAMTLLSERAHQAVTMLAATSPSVSFSSLPSPQNP
ncbi:tetratricopeptide repeat protein [bacterium]|nr:tetratricopeptide repeat protein [bacterium]